MARSEAVTFRAGDVELTGTLTLPDGPPPADRRGRYPNALLLPSWLPRDRDGGFDRVRHATWFAHGPGGEREGRPLARMADALAERGVAALRHDPRGCGASGGEWADADLFTLTDDARDALGWLRGRRDMDLSRTAMVGHGRGAGIALSVAISDPAVGALTLIGAAARSPRDVLRRAVAARERRWTDRDQPLVAALDRYAEELIERAARHEPRMTLPLPGGEAIDLALAGARQAFATPAMALATMLHRSTALVHGADDTWVDPSESTLLRATLVAAGNVEPSLVVVPGAGHGLAEASDATIGRIADDLVARIVPRELPPVLLAIEEMG